MKKILFTGGGSAGHVVPNLALMRELRFSCDLAYMGTGGVEKGLIESAGYPFFEVDCPKLRRSFTLKNLGIPFRLFRAVRQAEAILEEEKYDLVFSKGGYASYPAMRAAQKLGIPTLTHESDLSPGLCTRLIAKRARHVLTSFPETAKRFPNGVFVGSPVRKELFAGDRLRARHKFGLPAEGEVLLVFGGGSGSHVLNEALENALEPLLTRFSVLHLSGKGNGEARKVSESGTVYLRKEFEPDMGGAYAAASLVLSRAGSNTVFEILALKKRALLVPLAHASRGDQVENAAYFSEKGLVRVLPESELVSLNEKIYALADDIELVKNLENSCFESGTPRILSIMKATLQSGARE